ncbi:MAG: ferritin-like domain-containing protein [Acidimicrobiales bacterium]
MPGSEEQLAEITHAFAAHVRDESYVLDRYREVAAATGDPGTRFLLELVLADEDRHHEIFERLEASSEAEPPEGARVVPPPPRPEPEHRAVLLEHTRRFLEIERRDEVDLRSLAHELRHLREDTMWPLLVELMRLDTEKHVRVLEYLERCLRDAGR